MRRFKLLYAITDLEVGGAQTVLGQILRQLDRERFSPAVACLYGGDSQKAREIGALEVPVTDLKMRPKWNVAAVWRFYGLLRREKPDLLHGSLFHASLLSRVLGKLARVPVIVTWRQNVELGGAGREWLNRCTARWNDKVVAVCEPARRAEVTRSGAEPDKVVVLPNCVDIDQITSAISGDMGKPRSALGIPDGTLLLGAIGRLHPQKGLHVLLQAMQSLLKEGLSLHLVVVGDGRLREDLESACQRLEIGASTSFTGSRSDVPTILSMLDMLVLPSLWEGLPLIVLEAMAASLPVIASDVGGTSEAIVHGETGLLVPANDVAALARAIGQLANDKALRREMGQAGYRRAVQLFSAPVVTRRFERFYLDLLAEKGLV